MEALAPPVSHTTFQRVMYEIWGRLLHREHKMWSILVGHLVSYKNTVDCVTYCGNTESIHARKATLQWGSCKEGLQPGTQLTLWHQGTAEPLPDKDPKRTLFFHFRKRSFRYTHSCGRSFPLRPWQLPTGRENLNSWARRLPVTFFSYAYMWFCFS